MSDLSVVESIFFAALGKGSPEELAAYLDAACGQDQELRQHVERLLRTHPQVGSFLQGPAPALPATIDPQPLAEQPGTRIGPYKLLQQIGEGGMGVVYMAEQEQPLRRRVALKIVKPGMDTAQVIARFEAERQALALMDHQNIAKVFDAGATDSGRPYFVMELVHGVPITQYCDANKLSPRQRLELFVPVCQALQHAHQKGIIHRDLKPSNVLVTLHDGRPVPKVIDFGVAKATEQRLTDKTLFTQYGTMVGTLEYMAPEQAELSGLGVDTRSDIYSLGVLLYELLTGTTPLERRRLREAAYDEVLRLIREEEPPRPSLRISTSGERLATISAARGTEPALLSKLVRGELDWIVMKALEKDRTRRYETANGLARDVQRYLADEPVEACPPSAGYRLRKLARKHRAALLTATALAAMLVSGVVVSTWQAVRATQAQEAEAIQRQRAEENERQAKVSAEEAKAVLDFFRDKVLRAAAPEAQQSGLGPDVTLRKAVDAAAPQIAAAFQGQPLVEASIRDVLGSTFDSLGDYPAAVQQLERALTLRQARLGAEHADTLTSMHNLAESYGNAGKHGLALPLAEEALKRRKATLGPDHIDTLKSMLILAQEYKATGKPDHALPLIEETFERRKATLGPEHARTLNAMISLGTAYQAVGKLDRAIALLQDSVRLTKANLGPGAYRTCVAMSSLAEAYREAGKLDQALPLAEEALKLAIAKLSPEHPNTLRSRICLARVYQDNGKLDQALPLAEEAFKLGQAKLTPEHPNTLIIMGYLAEAYDAARNYPEALRLGQDLLAFQRRKLPADDPALAETLATLGLCLLHAQQPAEAEPLLRECLAIRQKKQADLWTTFQAQSLLGGSLLGQQKYADAEPLLRQGYEGMKQREAQIRVAVKIRLTEALERLVRLYDATGQKDKADERRKQLEEAGAAVIPLPKP
jgi:serine/threonine protein kinase